MHLVADEEHISSAPNQFSIPFTTSSQEKTVKTPQHLQWGGSEWVEICVWECECVSWVCVWPKSGRNFHKRKRERSPGAFCVWCVVVRLNNKMKTKPSMTESSKQRSLTMTHSRWNPEKLSEVFCSNVSVTKMYARLEKTRCAKGKRWWVGVLG